ncbi:MAG: FecR domain-containing protein [Alphaproteobacteria bacterium]|nr:FecR domain-containing protein [Alphaproteobacteria bacterium]
MDLFQDELIRTGNSGASRVVFQDRANLARGAGSEVKLDWLVFDPNPAKSQIASSIAKGLARLTTGNLPKSAYQITTPAATIGTDGIRTSDINITLFVPKKGAGEIGGAVNVLGNESLPQLKASHGPEPNTANDQSYRDAGHCVIIRPPNNTTRPSQNRAGSCS